MTRKVLKIVDISDEHKDIYLDGDLIMSMTHDAHGWDGMDAIETVAREIASRCGARIVEEFVGWHPPYNDKEAMLATLRGYFLNATEDTLLAASELLCEHDVDEGTVSDHIDLAVSVAKQHHLHHDIELLYTNVPGEFVGVTAEIRASHSADKTYELNHELAEMELGIKLAGVVFDVTFSVKR
jgi:hypothetical protein